MVSELDFLRRKLARMDCHVDDYARRVCADVEAECAEKVAGLEKELAVQRSNFEVFRKDMNNDMLQGAFSKDAFRMGDENLTPRNYKSLSTVSCVPDLCTLCPFTRFINHLKREAGLKCLKDTNKNVMQSTLALYPFESPVFIFRLNLPMSFRSGWFRR
jgi:hypothetical protein